MSIETKSCPSTEYSVPFIQGMINRMSISFAKYGKVKDAYPEKVNAIDSMMLRLKKYRETGNTEFLIDVANFAMIEFMHPAHPNAHFRPTDTTESPGRKWHDHHKPTAKPNDE